MKDCFDSLYHIHLAAQRGPRPSSVSLRREVQHDIRMLERNTQKALHALRRSKTALLPILHRCYRSPDQVGECRLRQAQLVARGTRQDLLWLVDTAKFAFPGLLQGYARPGKARPASASITFALVSTSIASSSALFTVFASNFQYPIFYKYIPKSIDLCRC